MENIVSTLLSNAEKYPEKDAFIYLDSRLNEVERVNFKELAVRVRCAAGFIEKNVPQKDARVLLCFPTGIDFITALFGCMVAGVIAVPVCAPHRNRKDIRLANILRDSDAAAVLVSSDLASRFEHYETKIIKFEQAVMDPDMALERDIDSRGLAFLQYTSGSTGDPKGVMVGHNNIAANLLALKERTDCSFADIFVNWLPLYHDLGLVNTILLPIHLGATSVLMSPSSFVGKPANWLLAIDRYKGTICGGPNFAYQLCVDGVDDSEIQGLVLKSWKIAFNAAEVVESRTLNAFSKRFSTAGFDMAAFYPSYGMAESTVFISGGRSGVGPVVRQYDEEKIRYRDAVAISDRRNGKSIVGCGTVSGAHELRIVDEESGLELEQRRIGEIWISGPSVCQGYWGRKSHSEETFRARLETSDRYWLRTGDLGFIDNGELYLTGRIKELIIINGENFHPTDIESIVQQSHSDLKFGSGAAFSIAGKRGEALVVVQEVKRGALHHAKWEEMCDSIFSSLEEVFQLCPAEVVLVKPATVSKTSSGKIQRLGIKEKFLTNKLPFVHRATKYSEKWAFCTSDLDCIATAPTTKTESALVDIFNNVISPLKVTRRDNYFHLGINSIKLSQIVVRINKELSKELALSDIFEHETIEELAYHIDDQRSRAVTIDKMPRTTSCTRRENDDLHDASVGQRRLWFISQFEEDKALYNEWCMFQIRGDVHVPALEYALRQVILRHEVLRCGFVEQDRNLKYKVHDDADPKFLRETADTFEKGRAIARRECDHVFDLKEGRLIRFKLIGLPDNTSLLSIVAHHIIMDSWSMRVFVDELMMFYRSFPEHPKDLPALLSTYRECAARRNDMLATQSLERDLAYWKRQLQGLPELHSLPVEKSRPPRMSFKGDAFQIHLEKGSEDRIRKFCNARKITPFMLFHAALAVVLNRYGNQEDIVVGTALSGRIQEEESLIGFFVNDVVLRVRIDSSSTLETLVGDCRRTLLDAIAHQSVPFDKIVEEINPSRCTSYNPIIQIKLDYLVHDYLDLAFKDLRLNLVEEGNDRCRYDLYLRVIEKSERLTLLWQYNTELFERQTAQRFSETFLQVLELVDSRCKMPLEETSILGAFDREWIREKRNSVDYDSGYRSVVELFEEQARLFPQNIAVSGPEGKTVYRDVKMRSDQLARILRSHGTLPDTLIGLCVETAEALCVGILGILKAGGAYVPLDPRYPPGHLERILEDSALSHVVTERSIAAEISFGHRTITMTDADILLLECRELDENQYPPVFPARDNLAYVIYTSGSTGRIKGVPITHGALFNSTRSRFVEYSSQPGSFAIFSSYAFDSFVAGFFWTICCGGKINIIDTMDGIDLDALQRTLKDESVSHLLLLPRLYREVLRYGVSPSKSTTTVIVAGEQCESALVLEHFKNPEWKSVKLYNEYGPTEATVWSTVYDCSGYETGIVPIGDGVAHCSVMLMNDQGKELPIGAVGEIHLGGGGLAGGYLNDPITTARKFVHREINRTRTESYFRTGDLARWTHGGQLEFLGRADHQIKIRGYRVEPGQIEQNIIATGMVNECVVSACRAGEATALAAYVLLHDLLRDEESNSNSMGAVSRKNDLLSKCKMKLKEQLPAYLVPGVWIALDSWPLTNNGKIDRKSLPVPAALEQDDAEYEGPRNEAEQQLCKIMEDLLGRRNVSIHDNFFELGGDSITSLQLSSRAREKGLSVTVADIFKRQSVAEIAAHIQESECPEISQEAAEGRQELLPIQRNFFSWRLPRMEHYNQALLLVAPAELEINGLRRIAQAIVFRHDALRLRFVESDINDWHGLYTPLSEAFVANVTEYHNLSGIAEGAHEEAVSSICRSVQTSLNPTTGPLFKMVLISLGADRKARLFLAFHHLVIDGVSWRILLSDMESCYENLGDRLDISLEPKTTSFQNWANTLIEFSTLPELQEQRSYWIEQLHVKVPRVSKYPANGKLTKKASVRAETIEFDREDTSSLLDACNQPYMTGTEELLLAALMRAYYLWSGHSVMRLKLEGHGREQIYQGINLTQTVGWFTTIYPVVLGTKDPTNFNTLIVDVKNACRSVPMHGIGYGVLKDIARDAEILIQDTHVLEDMIGFNYLGRFDNVFRSGSFSFASEDCGQASSPENIQDNLIDIIAFVKEGRMRLMLSCREDLIPEEFINELLETYKESIKMCIDHCLSVQIAKLRERYTANPKIKSPEEFASEYTL